MSAFGRLQTKVVIALYLGDTRLISRVKMDAAITSAFIGRYISISFLLLCLAIPAESLAQQDAPADEDQVEEIVVTGSRIKRRDFTSPSPISSIDKQVLAYSGQATLEEALNQMPQMQPDFGRTSNNPGNGTSRLNLRGLGSQRTLVMLNSRRLAPSGVGSAIDVNNLPQALIERVEIITGGASTVYGSDAIAGVVNFITRDDFVGFALDVSTYVTEKGDSESSDLNISYGRNFSGGRGNIRLFGSVLDREASFAGDREISAVPISDDWQGSLQQGGSPAIPAGLVFAPQVDLGDGLVFIRFDTNGDPVEFVDPDDLYNFAPVNYLQTPLRRYSGGLFLNYDISDRVETYIEASFTRNEATTSLAPVPAFGFFLINPDSPTLSAQMQQIAADQFFPAGPNLVEFGIIRRMLEVDLRIVESNQDYARLVAGLRGQINDNWDYDVWFTYTDGDEEKLQLNDVSFSRIQQGLLVDPVTGQCTDPSNGCVPVNPFGENNLSAEAVDFIRLAPLVNSTSRVQKLFSAVVTGSPFDSWAGPVDTAIGIEWRNDDGNFAADDALFTGDGLGYRGASGINGTEEVFEIYGEAIIPLARDTRFAEYLGLELGARYSDYDNAGSVDSYKIGGEWQVVDGLRLRTMFQRSVRAPNLSEAFEEQFIETSSFVFNDSAFDPCSASNNPAASGNAEKCILQGMPADQVGIFEASVGFPTDYTFGGNPELVPEEAETFTAGVVFNFEAAPNWQFAVDYFDLEVTDTIGQIDAAAICFDAANSANLFCSNLKRDPLTYNVNEVFEPTSNRGKSKTSGVDTQVTYQTELPQWMAIGDSYSDLSVNLIWTYLREKSTQENLVATPLDCRGKFGWPCNVDNSGETFPNNRVTTNASYSSGALNIHLTWRWIDGTDNPARQQSASRGVPDPILQIPSIGSKNYFDLGFGYAFSDNISAKLNISNLINTDPPFMANSSKANNTDETMYDIFGRSYYLSLALRY